MAGSSLVVEFLGLPGSGKSTLSHRIADQLTARGLRVSQRSYDLAHGPSCHRRRLLKTAHVAREVLLHPLASLQAARAIATTRQHNVGTRFKLLFNWLLVVSLARAARLAQGVHLLDQGLLQAIWSIALEDDSDAALALLGTAPARRAMPDVVVVVEASLDVVHVRLRERPEKDSRIEYRLAAEQLLVRGDHLLSSLRRTLAAQGVRMVIAHNEASDLDTLATELAGQLEPPAAPPQRAAMT